MGNAANVETKTEHLREDLSGETPLTRQLFDELYDASFEVGTSSERNFREYKRALTLAAQRSLARWGASGDAVGSGEAPFQVLDFFCGSGGMSAGFASLSKARPFFDVIGGCDIDRNAADAYSTNFDATGSVRDINSLLEDERALENFLEDAHGYDSDKPLVVIGCAPCQGFSAHRKRHWSREDERNTLVGAFASLATKLKPACIVLENVPEMLSGRYWKHFAEARDVLAEAGYTVRQAIYNAASFGVPQERFRSLVIAMKKDFLMPEPLLEYENFVTVRDAIGHLPSVPAGAAHPEDELHRSAGHKTSTLETIRAVPKDGGSRPVGVGPECLDRVKGYYDVYGRLYWDRPAITVTHYARNPASGRYIHPEQDRGLTVREAALLQSFPKGYAFSGSFDAMFKQIGEAVPPKFSCAVAASVLIEMLSPEPSEIEEERAFRSISEPVQDSYSGVIAGIKTSRRTGSK